jgi:hypothetical protein
MIHYNSDLHKELILKEISSWSEEQWSNTSYIPRNEPLTAAYIEIDGETYRVPMHIMQQLVMEANKEVIDEYQNSFIDQQFGMDTFVPKRIYYNKVYNLSETTTDTRIKKWTAKIDYTK